MDERKAFEAWAQPFLGDNPTWRESALCELGWQAWQAATLAERERAAKVCDDEANEWLDHADNHAADDEDKRASLNREDSLREVAAAIRKG